MQVVRYRTVTLSWRDAKGRGMYLPRPFASRTFSCGLLILRVVRDELEARLAIAQLA